jgi:HEAT repeat protein
MDPVAVLEDPKAGYAAKAEAARALAGRTDARSLAALAHALDATHEDVKGAARDALLAGGGATRFADALRSRTTPLAERVRAASVLRHLRDPATVPSLAHALGDPEEPVRAAAAHALAVFGAEAAKDALVRALEDPSPEVRYFAVLALSTLPGNQATAALEARRKVEPDEGVRAELDRVLAAP